MTAQGQAVTAGGEESRGWVQEHRRELAPLYAIVAVIVAGAMAHEAATGLRWLAIGAAVVVLGLAWWRWRRGDSGLWRYAVAVGATTAGWLLWVALAGLSVLALGVAAVAGLGLGVPWWRTYRGQFAGPPARAAVKPVGALGDVIETWEQYVSAEKGQALPNSHLTGLERVDSKGGWSATIVLPRGLSTADAAVAATGKIASAYELPIGSVMIEAPPDGVASHARILVLPDNPLYETKPFLNPSLDPETGCCKVGTYADGSLAPWRFWMPGSGGTMGFVAGTTGSGKSRLVEQLLAEARHSGLITTWVIDPQGGQSLPAWMDAVDWSVRSTEDGLDMLLAAKKVMMARSRHLARQAWTDKKGRPHVGLDHFEPTPDMPLLLLVIEEAPQLFQEQPDAVPLVASLGKMGRKCGMSLVLCAQRPTVSELGDSSTIRSMVKSGVVACLRTSDGDSARMVFPGRLPGNPADIPDQLPNGKSSGGLGYIGGAGARTAMMRTFYLDDPYEWASTGSPVALDQLSARAAGPAYAAAHTADEPVSEADAATEGDNLAGLRLVDDVASDDHGDDLLVEDVAGDEPGADGVERNGTFDEERPPLAVVAPRADEGGTVDAEVEVEVEVTRVSERAIDRPIVLPDGLTADDVVRRVIEAAGGREVSTYDVLERCGRLEQPNYRYSPRAVASALRKLTDEQQIQKIKQGRYRANGETLRMGSSR